VHWALLARGSRNNQRLVRELRRCSFQGRIAILFAKGGRVTSGGAHGHALNFLMNITPLMRVE
jgi:hypothetical protein